MSSRFRVPTLTNPNVVIRFARSYRETSEADQLIYRSYVNLYWPENEEAFRANKYLRLPTREIFIASDASRIVGTMSIIKDSPAGLPSDTFRPDILMRYRQSRNRLAEVTSFAVDQSVRHPLNLIFFLIKYLMQYSFYYANVDRLIASCRPKHADFYEERLCFEKLTPPTPYDYAGNVECQLVTIGLLRAHALLADRYGNNHADEDNFYRFLMVDEHPNVRLPEKRYLRRSRNLDWAAYARRADMPIAV